MSPTLHPRQIIGILGGLGPYAHLPLEKRLLDAAREYAGVVREQDFPEWILSSMPQTPDRTSATLGNGPSPMPWLLRGLRRLEPHRRQDGEEIPGADSVLIPCNTAHIFLHHLRSATSLPLLDMVSLCAQHVGHLVKPGTRIGLLATTGTLKSRLYHRALEANGLSALSPFESENGEELQRDLVMAAIFGPAGSSQAGSQGLKNLGAAAVPHARRSLLQAAELLVEGMGCQALIAGCTEIHLAIPEKEVLGVPLVDPLEILAREAIFRVYELPRALS